jgi:cytochrome c553
MRKVIAVTIAGLMLASMMTTGVQATPDVKKAFDATYPDVKAAKKTTCAVCHPSKSKKKRNNYGVALSKAGITKKLKWAKDKDAMEKAIKDAAKGKSATADKTFQDLLDDKKWPGDDKEAN